MVGVRVGIEDGVDSPDGCAERLFAEIGAGVDEDDAFTRPILRWRKAPVGSWLYRRREGC